MHSRTRITRPHLVDAELAPVRHRMPALCPRKAMLAEAQTRVLSDFMSLNACNAKESAGRAHQLCIIFLLNAAGLDVEPARSVTNAQVKRLLREGGSRGNPQHSLGFLGT